MNPEDVGRRAAERAIQYRSQLAGIGVEGLLETLVQDGKYPSKGVAARALGINEGLPGLTPSLTRLLEGLAGASPALPNRGSCAPRRPWWRRMFGLA